MNAKEEKAEEWKAIRGYENLYEISSKGKVRNCITGKINFSKRNSKKYYLTVVLCKNKKHTTKRIHRLVAEAFIPNPLNKKEVNHKDMNKHNNTVENLEWVTPKENIQHAIKRKPEMVAGMVNYNKYIRPKKVIQKTLNDKIVAVYNNAIEAQEKTGVCSRNITQVASKEQYKPNKIRKQAGGYKWEYIQEGGSATNEY